MASAPAFMTLGDLIARRVMFALELVDPVTRRLVSNGVKVVAKDFGRPTHTPSARFVWNDVDPPAVRDITLTITSLDGQFADQTVQRQISAHLPTTPAADLVETVILQPTGLYRVPTGLSAASGMLIDNRLTRAPIVGAEVRLHYRHAHDSAIAASRYAGLTDARGGFVAALPDLADPEVMPLTVGLNAPVCWLKVTLGDDEKFTPLLPMRIGRPLQLPNPLIWDELHPDSPPAP